MWRQQVAQYLVILGISGVLWNAIPANAQKRVVFSESPAAVEHYFGQYWTRLTLGEGRDRTVTYTYNPQAVRQLFQAENATLSVRFVNDQADLITIQNLGVVLEQQQSETDWYPPQFDQLYEILFGERPPSDSPVHGRLILDTSGEAGTLQTSTYCLDDGVAISYEWASDRDLITYATIFPEADCAVSASSR